MQRFPKGAMLAAGLLAVLSAPIAVQAQKAQAEASLSQPAVHEAGGPALPPPGPGRMSGLDLAAHLAATGTWLGITDQQQAVWRDYCQALIGFLEPETPGPADPGQLMAERMARGALARADKAQALLAATTALRGALQPEQMAPLIDSQPDPRAMSRPMSHPMSHPADFPAKG